MTVRLPDIQGAAVPIYEGDYFLPTVLVPHPTEIVPGRVNLIALNHPGMGMRADEDGAHAQAQERVVLIQAAYRAMAELSDQELDWVHTHIKNNVR